MYATSLNMIKISWNTSRLTFTYIMIILPRKVRVYLKFDVESAYPDRARVAGFPDYRLAIGIYLH